LYLNLQILEYEKFRKIIQIIQIQGDKRKDIKTYLLENNISSEEDIIIHGF
jgi:translation initiation factor 1 (eIF-1/SUI1)